MVPSQFSRPAGHNLHFLTNFHYLIPTKSANSNVFGCQKNRKFGFSQIVSKSFQDTCDTWKTCFQIRKPSQSHHNIRMFRRKNFVDVEFHENFEENLMRKRDFKSNEFGPHITPCFDVDIFKNNFNYPGSEEVIPPPRTDSTFSVKMASKHPYVSSQCYLQAF